MTPPTALEGPGVMQAKPPGPLGPSQWSGEFSLLLPRLSCSRGRSGMLVQ